MITTSYRGNIITLIVPTSYKKITVGVSGGADSAILLYLLAKEIKYHNPQCVVDTFTVPRPDNGSKYSPKIVEYITNKLQVNISAPDIIGDGNIDHTIVVGEAIKQIINSNNYDKIYIGENRIQEGMGDAISPTRSPNKFAWRKINMPFYDLDKSEILELYFIEGVEDLLTLSHSCTTNTVGRCNWCYNCTERKWGFDQLGKTDPGTS